MVARDIVAVTTQTPVQCYNGRPVHASTYLDSHFMLHLWATNIGIGSTFKKDKAGNPASHHVMVARDVVTVTT